MGKKFLHCQVFFSALKENSSTPEKQGFCDIPNHDTQRETRVKKGSQEALGREEYKHPQEDLDSADQKEKSNQVLTGEEGLTSWRGQTGPRRPPGTAGYKGQLGPRGDTGLREWQPRRGSCKYKVVVAASRFRTPLCPRRSIRLHRKGDMRVSGEILPFLPISNNDGELAIGLQGLVVAKMPLPWGIALCLLKLLPGCTGFCVVLFCQVLGVAFSDPAVMRRSQPFLPIAGGCASRNQ
ncbi:uncharacterized protein LOC142059664 [Phalacrocorax aristotelis]|uniref:uncharacterized protein LOC142059664 n=1 Tax=Phalacrocorax aristotelis TaxID=126867 RepID=UPI003F4CA56C